MRLKKSREISSLQREGEREDIYAAHPLHHTHISLQLSTSSFVCNNFESSICHTSGSLDVSTSEVYTRCFVFIFMLILVETLVDGHKMNNCRKFAQFSWPLSFSLCLVSVFQFQCDANTIFFLLLKSVSWTKCPEFPFFWQFLVVH